MNPLQIILYPFSLLWAVVLRIRHLLYDQGILESRTVDTPTICVGNLSFGGTGKTPHVLFISRLLSKQRPAILSRGYGRKTSGYIKVNESSLASDVGDEPLMMFSKSGGVASFHVDRNRLIGAQIIERSENPGVVILDDAFQHRRIKAGLNILLTTFQKPYFRDYLVPSGTLRDVRFRASAADAVIVTKCPPQISIDEPEWRKDLKLRDDQLLVFSSIAYEEFQEVRDSGQREVVRFSKQSEVLVLTGIADAQPMCAHIAGSVGDFVHLAFRDHHQFSSSDMDKALRILANFAATEKWVITTEKDLVRLGENLNWLRDKGVRVAVLPIGVRLLHGSKELEQLIFKYVG